MIPRANNLNLGRRMLAEMFADELGQGGRADMKFYGDGYEFLGERNVEDLAVHFFVDLGVKVARGCRVSTYIQQENFLSK